MVTRTLKGGYKVSRSVFLVLRETTNVFRREDWRDESEPVILARLASPFT